MKIKAFVSDLALRLEASLPGEKIQKQMRAVPRARIHYERSKEKARPASVLILFFEKNHQIHFILTERTHNVDTHRGQISLPGGTREDGEPLHETAVRETYEEIGIPKEMVTVIGRLTPLYVPVSGFIIHPWLGWMEEIPELNINPREVESAFSVPIRDLLDDARVKAEKWNLYGMELDVPFFQLHRFKVWGATAMILSELKEILKDLK